MEQRLERNEAAAAKSLVAQIFNLLYRRVALGRASDNPIRVCNSKAPQIENLRYGRMQFCATSLRRSRQG